MIDPTQAIAFSLASTSGAYALLVGSGISRSAGIPTGWDITLELVKKLALLNGHTPAKPEDWYRETYKKAPDYAELLELVTQTPTERQQLLRSYWEASDAERERGLKQPTTAHRRIADLVSLGTIKVIITTNFDRLLETALADVGIVPTVISTVDQIKGAMPLIHCKCCVIKVHGDYLDTRIRNTPAELEKYEPELDRLLDRVFDEFGLISCGWSADWDVALSAAIDRAPSRRFAMYWATRGTVGDRGQALIAARAGTVVPIKNADQFFEEVYASVKALHEFAKPHPISKEIALANLKQYVASSNYAVQLEDLVLGEAEKAERAVRDYAFPMKGGPTPDADSFTKRIHAYAAATETITAMAAIGGYWATPNHKTLWRRALEIVYIAPDDNGSYHAWVGAAHYPAMILFYSVGVAAVSAENYALLAELFSAEAERANRTLTAVEVLPPICAFEDNHGPTQFLNGYLKRRLAMNEYLRDQLRALFKRIHPQDKAYNRAFDKFEMLVSLAFLWRAKRTEANFWTPPGLWFMHDENRNSIHADIAKSLSEEKENSPYASGIFSDDWADASNRLVLLKEQAPTRFGGLFF